MQRSMRSVLVLMALAAVNGTAQAQQQDAAQQQAIAVAERFLTLLRGSDWTAASALVADAVPAGTLGTQQLETVWGQVRSSVGELRTTTLHAVTPVDTLLAVELIGDFATQKFLVRVVVTPSGKVTGFFLRQAPTTGPLAGPPAYADTAKFREERVTVGADPWKLPGILTLPRASGRHPVVVLVHGSGPNDRDETVGPNKPFRDIAWGLASAGIAVLRYDKRTLVHGATVPMTLTVEGEVIEDALAALALVRAHPDIDPARVYLVGHSLGAMLAPEIAQRDARLAGAVMLAAPARDLITVMGDQFDYAAALPENAAPAAQTQIAAMRAELQKAKSGNLKDSDMLLGAPVSYFMDLQKRSPVPIVQKLSTPVLMLHGERDYQVTMVDYRLWQTAVAGSPHITLQLMPGLNHLFITGTGASSPAEYVNAGHVAPEVVMAIRSFVMR